VQLIYKVLNKHIKTYKWSRHNIHIGILTAMDALGVRFARPLHTICMEDEPRAGLGMEEGVEEGMDQEAETLHQHRRAGVGRDAASTMPPPKPRMLPRMSVVQRRPQVNSNRALFHGGVGGGVGGGGIGGGGTGGVSRGGVSRGVPLGPARGRTNVPLQSRRPLKRGASVESYLDDLGNVGGVGSSTSRTSTRKGNTGLAKSTGSTRKAGVNGATKSAANSAANSPSPDKQPSSASNSPGKGTRSMGRETRLPSVADDDRGLSQRLSQHVSSARPSLSVGHFATPPMSQNVGSSPHLFDDHSFDSINDFSPGYQAATPRVPLVGDENSSSRDGGGKGLTRADSVDVGTDFWGAVTKSLQTVGVVSASPRTPGRHLSGGDGEAKTPPGLTRLETDSGGDGARPRLPAEWMSVGAGTSGRTEDKKTA
jgi:hypothetical protein